MNILAATVTFFYTISGGVAYQACYQKVGGSPTCQAMAADTTTITGLDDDADYDFWVKSGGIDSAKVRVRTQKKTIAPPAVVIQP